MTAIASKTQKEFKGDIDHEKTLGFMISNPVKGNDGAYIAIREAINNSFDVGATEIKIKFGTYEKNPALFISDNGAGFSHVGVNSAMSYFISSRKREDLKTIGTNGTGIKGFLGLGKFEKTRLTILSTSKELGPVKMDVTFQYLVDLANKKAEAEEYVTRLMSPLKEWRDADIKRTTGTTLILTGFDARKLKRTDQIINELGEYLTPKSSKCIKVLEEGKWKDLVPPAFKGVFYDFSYKTEGLGNIIFELYYGGNGEGPVVCGSMNAIIGLGELCKEMKREQKKRISKIWKSVAGHIYMDNANQYRLHDNSFSEKFYENKACEELVEVLNAVSEELIEKSEEKKTSELMQRQQILINRIVEAGRLISPPGNIDEGKRDETSLRPFGNIESEEDIYIVPKVLRLLTRQEQQITLRNSGKKEISFDNAEWKSAGVVTVLSYKGASAKVKSGQYKGEGEIQISGSFGQHTIKVEVDDMSMLPFVQGPRYVKPGSSHNYKLQRYEKFEVNWKLEKAPNGISLIATSDRKTVAIKIENNREDCSFELIAFEKGVTDKVIARKKVSVLQDGTFTKLPASIIHIGELDYVLSIEANYPATVAQIDYYFNDGDTPQIVVNPTHPRIKNMKFFYSIDHILAAIANAAMIDQVSKGAMKASEAPARAEDFILKIKSELFKKDAEGQQQ